MILLCIIIFLVLKIEGKGDPNKLADFSIANAGKSSIKFRIFSKGVEVGIFDETSITRACFNKKLATKFLVHGWTASEISSGWYKNLKVAYEEEKLNYNIIYVDWSKASGETYPISAANTKIVAKDFADFITTSGLNVTKIHLIAHSLGSHLCGFVGKLVYKKLGRKLLRITALDPAGPRFEYATSENRLHKNDALMVDVIHTDINNYGYFPRLGHVDFYPNGGDEQPGCVTTNVTLVNCNHARSYYLYVESIKSKIKTYSAKTWDDYRNRNFGKHHAIFGEHLKMISRGKFYFKTRNSSPFLSQ